MKQMDEYKSEFSLSIESPIEKGTVAAMVAAIDHSRNEKGNIIC